MILFQTNFTSFLPHLMSRNQSLQIYMQQRNSFEMIKPERKSSKFSFEHDLSLQLVVGINLICLDDNLYPTSKSSFNTHVGSSLHNRLYALLVCWLISPWINNSARSDMSNSSTALLHSWYQQTKPFLTNLEQIENDWIRVFVAMNLPFLCHYGLKKLLNAISRYCSPTDNCCIRLAIVLTFCCTSYS